MTTTSSTSSATTTSKAAIVSTLGAGSGIDITSLANQLVEAERAPRKDRIDGKINKTEARISGYGALKVAISDLQKAFQTVDDASEFNSLTVANSQSAALSVTTTATADAGVHTVSVSQLARAQRSVAGFATRSTALNGGQPMWLQFTVAGKAAAPVKVRTDTPAGLVSAINGAKLGVTAQLIDTGSGVKVVLTGAEGAANTFSVSAVTDDGSGQSSTTAVDAVDFGTPQQPAQDASFTVDGQAITRSSNTVSDVVEGVTFRLQSLTTGEARIELQRDTTAIKTNLKALVSAYNTFQDSLDVLNDPGSQVETFGGALAGDSLLRSIRNQVRAMVTTASSTPGDAATTHAWGAGISIDRGGRMTLDEAKLDTALADHFQGTMTMFTAGKSGKSVYSTAKAGVAGDAVRSLDKMLRSTGLIDQSMKSATAQVTGYQKDLTRLEDQMSKLLERYTQQFSAMDDIVGQSKSTRSNLTNSFASMLGTNTK